jgi:hypothetical protein
MSPNNKIGPKNKAMVYFLWKFQRGNTTWRIHQNLHKGGQNLSCGYDHCHAILSIVCQLSPIALQCYNNFFVVIEGHLPCCNFGFTPTMGSLPSCNSISKKKKKVIFYYTSWKKMKKKIIPW